MPDGNTPTTQDPESTTAAAAAAPSNGSRSIDAFPEDAQDYIRRLRAENASHRTGLKEAQTRLKEFEDREKTEAQKLLERAESAERAVANAALQTLRYEIAAEAGLPLSLAGRLQGSTKDELKADAEKLKQDFRITDDGVPAAGGSGFDGGVRRPVSRPKSMNGLIRAATGR